MAHWKLYEASSEYGWAKLPETKERPLRNNPLVIPLEFDAHSLEAVAETATSAQLAPVVITTSDFIHLITTALSLGLRLKGLEFNRALSPHEDDLVAAAVSNLTEKGGLERLQKLLTSFLRQRTIVSRATFAVLLTDAEAEMVVRNNGVVTVTGGREALEIADPALSVLGRLSAAGVMT